MPGQWTGLNKTEKLAEMGKSFFFLGGIKQTKAQKLNRRAENTQKRKILGCRWMPMGYSIYSARSIYILYTYVYYVQLPDLVSCKRKEQVLADLNLTNYVY